ncbi:MAG: T9SS type A sorting domain-containing protein [Bacteroidota bacterium]|nr:T9SS type A sorting domain-containing protein [Bacteroidota bacterium]
MKKITLLLAVAIYISNWSFGQLVQATIAPGSTSTSVKIFLQADVTQTPASFSTLQFNIGIPASTSPIPIATVISTAFTGVTWIVGAPYSEGGYINYNIYTASSPLTINIVMNTPFEAMEVQFSGGPSTSQSVALVTLPDGGVTPPSFAIFYATGTVNSDGHSNLYYPGTSAVVDNKFSYDNPSFTTPGTGTSTATIVGVILPVRLTNFAVTKKAKDAILTWQVSNQDANSAYFELEKGFTGTDFKKIGRVDVNSNSGSTASYSFNDVNIVSAKASGVVFYRLKMVDKDGRFTYSEVRNIKLNNKSFAVNLYPNPAKGFSNVTVELDNPSQIRLSISDAAGRIVQNIEFAGFKGLNQKKLDLSKLAGGSYMLKVNNGSEIQTVPMVKE